MRTPNIGTPFYSPGDPPTQAADVPLFLRTELLKIKAAFDALALGHLDWTYVAPTKPRAVDLRAADGTQWNPGSGRGLYAYNGTSWVLIKAL